MSDYIIRGTAVKGQVRFFAATTRRLVEEARRIHDLSRVSTAALGRLLTGGAMMGAMCKNDTDVLTLQIQCDGPIGGMVVTADAGAKVKGYVLRPTVELPPKQNGKLDVGGAVGNGTLHVIKDIGLREPYVGQTNLVTGEIAEDLTAYFAVSEQIPTAVSLGVLVDRDNSVKQAGGFIIQMLPQAEPEVDMDALADVLELRLAAFASITALMEDGMVPETMMEALFQGYDMVIHDRLETGYACNCSKERVESVIASIGRREIQEMIAEGLPIDVNCHFCNKTYSFDVEDLRQILLYDEE